MCIHFLAASRRLSFAWAEAFGGVLPPDLWFVLHRRSSAQHASPGVPPYPAFRIPPTPERRVTAMNQMLRPFCLELHRLSLSFRSGDSSSESHGQGRSRCQEGCPLRQGPHSPPRQGWAWARQCQGTRCSRHTYVWFCKGQLCPERLAFGPGKARIPR